MALFATNVLRLFNLINFFIMGNFNEFSRGQRIANWFIKVFAIVVKWFPKLALRFTVKTNWKAQFFLLPSAVEEMFLKTMSHEEIVKRIWRPETRKRLLGSNLVVVKRALVQDLILKEEFDILLENADRFMIKEVLESRQYTPNQKQVVAFLKKFDSLETIKSLVQNHPSVITSGILGEISEKACGLVFESYLRNLSNIGPLLEAVVLRSFNDEDTQKTVRSFLMSYRNQIPEKPSVFAHLQSKYPDVFEQLYRSKKKEDIATLCLNNWCENNDWEWVNRLKNGGSYSVLASIAVSMLNHGCSMRKSRPEEYKETFDDIVATLLSGKYACPAILPALKNDEFRQMLALSLTMKNVLNIPYSAINLMETEELKRYCYLVAENGRVFSSPSIMDKLSEDDKRNIMKIYEDLAYIKWLKSHYFSEHNVSIFCKMTLSRRVQLGCLGDNYGEVWLSEYASSHVLDDETLKEMIILDKVELLKSYLKVHKKVSKAVKDALLVSQHNCLVAEYFL